MQCSPCCIKGSSSKGGEEKEGEGNASPVQGGG